MDHGHKKDGGKRKVTVIQMLRERGIDMSPPKEGLRTVDVEKPKGPPRKVWLKDLMGSFSRSTPLSPPPRRPLRSVAEIVKEKFPDWYKELRVVTPNPSNWVASDLSYSSDDDLDSDSVILNTPDRDSIPIQRTTYPSNWVDSGFCMSSDEELDNDSVVLNTPDRMHTTYPSNWVDSGFCMSSDEELDSDGVVLNTPDRMHWS